MDEMSVTTLKLSTNKISVMDFWKNAYIREKYVKVRVSILTIYILFK